jgi:hypothetical protein
MISGKHAKVDKSSCCEVAGIYLNARIHRTQLIILKLYVKKGKPGDELKLTLEYFYRAVYYFKKNGMARR